MQQQIEPFKVRLSRSQTATVEPRRQPVKDHNFFSEEADVSMNGYYQLIEGHEGGFMFSLRAGNHETILESRVYWSRQTALDAIEALRQASQNLNNFTRHERVDGCHFFEVRDGQSQMLARSPGCVSKSGLTAGIASVQRNAPSKTFRGLVRRSLTMG